MAIECHVFLMFILNRHPLFLKSSDTLYSVGIEKPFHAVLNAFVPVSAAENALPAEDDTFLGMDYQQQPEHARGTYERYVHTASAMHAMACVRSSLGGGIFVTSWNLFSDAARSHSSILQSPGLRCSR